MKLKIIRYVLLVVAYVASTMISDAIQEQRTIQLVKNTIRDEWMTK